MFLKKKQPDSFSRYVDPTGELPTGELKAGYWYVTHKLLLARVGIGALLVWSVVSVGYSLFAWGRYLFVEYRQDEVMLQRQLAEIENYADLQPLYQARQLAIGSTDVFESAQQRYDFVTFVTNPNERFLAHVTFSYQYSGGETSTTTVTLLPNIQQALPLFGHEMDRFPATARLVIHAIEWQRISPHVIPDVATFTEERLSFSAEQLVVHDAGSDEVPLTQIQFDLTNTTVYGYWQPRFLAQLVRGGRVVGVHFLSFDQFQGQETRPVKFHSQGSVNGANDIRLIPLFNIFDLDEYMTRGA